MFISATINEITREIKWDKSQVAAVDGDYAVNGFKLTCLGLDPDYNLTTGTWYAVFTAQDGTSHSNPLTVSGGVVTWEFDNNINKGGSGVVKFFLYAVTANTTGKILKRWDSAITDLRVAGTIDYENQEEEAARESEIDRLAGLVTTLTATAATINDVKTVISRITNSSPVVVATVADLSGLDTTKYQLAIVRADGYLYYYDGTAWQKGIKYGSYELDTTLTESGKAADAAAVGAKISQIKEDLIDLSADVGDVSALASTYSASSMYAVGDYVLYDGTVYKCNTAITTAEEWTAAHWTATNIATVLADANTRLNMLVTMQEVEEEEDEPVEGITQLLNPSDFSWNNIGGRVVIKEPHIPYVGDGIYYPNPHKASSSSIVEVKPLYYAKFYDAYRNQLTLTSTSDSSTRSYLSIFMNYATWIEIVNGRTIRSYVTGRLAGEYTTEADIAWFGGSGSFVGYFDTEGADWGVTYGGYSESYVAYTGEDTGPEYTLNYVPAMAAYVETYMQSRGSAASNNMFNYYYPESDNSEFANAVKYYHERADRQRNRIIRFGSFNKYVSRGRSNWSVIKQELADYSVDVCGFQECGAIVSDGAVTAQIGAYLQGWQFGGYAVQDTEIDKAIVSHWDVAQTDILTLVEKDSSDSTCIHALMTIPADNWFSNAVDADFTLSVYSYHGCSGNATIGGTSYTAYAIRMMEIEALLTVLATDTADFIVVVGDTNCFESGYNLATGTHAEWEAFRDAGFTPVLPGYDSTCTTTSLDVKYFCKADDNKVYCLAAYDQIFIGSNITAKRYGVVDSNLYPVASLGGVPVSDHCMIYADLEFDFDAVAQAKLAEIATTEQWW